MVRSEKDVFFKKSTFNLIMLNQHIFPYGFDSVHLVVNIQFSEVNTAKRTSTNLLLDVKVIESHFDSRRSLVHND